MDGRATSLWMGEVAFCCCGECGRDEGAAVAWRMGRTSGYTRGVAVSGSTQSGEAG